MTPIEKLADLAANAKYHPHPGEAVGELATAVFLLYVDRGAPPAEAASGPAPAPEEVPAPPPLTPKQVNQAVQAAVDAGVYSSDHRQ